MYSSSLHLTSAVDGGGWLTPRLGHFIPGKETQDSNRVCGPQAWSVGVRDNPPPRGFDPQTVQPTASRCIGYSIPAHEPTVCVAVFSM